MTGINIPREEGGVVTSSTTFKTIKRVIYEQSFTPTYIYIYIYIFFFSGGEATKIFGVNYDIYYNCAFFFNFYFILKYS